MIPDAKHKPWSLVEWRAHLYLLRPGMFDGYHVILGADGNADVRISFGLQHSELRRKSVLAGLMASANERGECVTLESTRLPAWISRKVRP